MRNAGSRDASRQDPGGDRSSLLLCVACSALLGAAAPCADTTAVEVVIDPGVEYQTIDGLGGSAANEFTLRDIPEPSRSEVMDLVFGDLEPSVVRIKIWPAIEPVNDDDDPHHVNPDGFVPVEDQLWQLDEIAARGDPRLIAAPWTPPAWMKTTQRECCGGSLLPEMEPEFAELVSVYLGVLADAGHPLDWLSIQNEPEAVAPWDSNTYTPSGYARMIELIAQRLRADGIDVGLAAPDMAVPAFVPLFLPAILATPTASGMLEAVAFHLYSLSYYDAAGVGPTLATLGAATPPGLPLWMTEFSNTTGIGYGSHDEGIAQAELMHEALVGGASMYVMWNLYRPGGPGEALVVISTSGAPDYTVTPKYWTARQYMKYVKPGAVRIEASSADPDVRVSAFRDDARRVLTAVLINRADDSRWATFPVPGLRGPARVIRTSPEQNGAELGPGSAERRGHRAVRLPGRSVTTIVWPTTLRGR